jgi:DHA1 family multidrug resistance protein-like MFS transporter
MLAKLAAAFSKHTRVPVLAIPAVRQLLLITLLAEIGYAILNISTMPVYLAHEPFPARKFIAEGRGLGPGVIGLVLVAFLLSEAIFKTPMGTLADRFGQRRFLLIGPCITCVTSLLTLVIPLNIGDYEVLFLVLLRVADGIGSAMIWPAAYALMSDSVDDDNRQNAMSMLNLCYMLGIALALPIGGWVDDLTGHKWSGMFLASGIFACVAISVYYLVPQRANKVHSVSEESVGFSEFLRSARAIPNYLILSAVTFMGIGFPMAIVKLFALEEYKMSESSFGTFVVLPGALAMAALVVPLSRYGERIGKSRAVHVGLGLCAGGLTFCSLGAFFPALRMPWALAVGGAPVGLGFLLTIPAWMASVSDIDPKRRGANIGAVMTAQGLGAIVGAPIGAVIYEKLIPVFGVHIAHYSPFLCCAACVTTGWLLSFKMLRVHRER